MPTYVSVPESVPTTVTRKRFRELIDPLLAGLGVQPESVVSCSFDADGFEVVLFHRDEQGRRITLTDRVVLNKEGGRSFESVCAKVLVQIPVDDRVMGGGTDV